MADATKDSNQIAVLMATSNSDGSTLVRVKVNASTHILTTSDGSTGSDLSGDIAKRDNNGVPALMGVSSVDGVTPTAIYADPATGALLIKST